MTFGKRPYSAEWSRSAGGSCDHETTQHFLRQTNKQFFLTVSKWVRTQDGPKRRTLDVFLGLFYCPMNLEAVLSTTC